LSVRYSRQERFSSEKSSRRRSPEVDTLCSMPDSLPVLICRSIKADSGYQAMDRRQGNGIGFLRQSSSAAGIATADLVYPRRRQKSNQWLLELFSEDKECDFFHDVAHIQKNKTHKGLAASSQTATASRAEQRKSAIAGLSGLIIPLLLQSILEGKAKQNYLGQRSRITSGKYLRPSSLAFLSA